MIDADLNRTNTSFPQEDILGIDNITKCRICHEDQGHRKLLVYCSCKPKYGSMHELCLKTYLQKKFNHLLSIELDVSSALTCERCSQEYRVHYLIKRRCSQLQKLRKNVLRKTFEFGVYLLGMIISTIVLIVCSNQLGKSSKEGIISLQNSQKTALICSIVFSSCLILVFVFKIFNNFLIVTTTQITV